MSAGVLPQDAALPLRNAKHEAVLQHYFGDPARVGFKAYLAVYPNSSDGAAKTAFSRLRKNAEFEARLKFLDAAITERVVDDSVMSAQEVLQELSKLGRSSIKKVIVNGDTTSELVDSVLGLPDAHAATVKSLTVESYMEGSGDDAREVKRVKIELHDKRGPLRDLAQHYSLLTEKHELTGKDGGPIETAPVELSELELARRIAFALEQGARSATKARKPESPKASKKGKAA